MGRGLEKGKTKADPRPAHRSLKASSPAVRSRMAPFLEPWVGCWNVAGASSKNSLPLLQPPVKSTRVFDLGGGFGKPSPGFPSGQAGRGGEQKLIGRLS